MKNTRAFFIAVVAAGSLLVSSCGRTSHSIECLAVNGQTVCFVRDVWTRSGYRVTVTTSTDVCHQPSTETDFVSDPGAGDVYYKIDDGVLHIYGLGPVKMPRKEFPVAVKYDDLMNPGEAKLLSNGYSRLPLEDTTWCLSDFK